MQSKLAPIRSGGRREKVRVEDSFVCEKRWRENVATMQPANVRHSTFDILAPLRVGWHRADGQQLFLHQNNNDTERRTHHRMPGAITLRNLYMAHREQRDSVTVCVCVCACDCVRRQEKHRTIRSNIYSACADCVYTCMPRKVWRNSVE